MTAFALSAALLVAADAKFLTEVNAARDKAIDYLKKKQNNDGHWEGTGISLIADMEGGQTALVVLALLEAGVPSDDPALAKALKYLEKLEPKKTYVVGLSNRALAATWDVKYVPKIQKNADWLIDKAIWKHTRAAGWSLPQNPLITNSNSHFPVMGLHAAAWVLENALKKNQRLEGWSYPQNHVADNSNTHFAVMGLHAAAQAGAKIDAKVWGQIRDYYTRTQQKGGWTYLNERGSASMSMTGCGLLGLAIAAKYDKKTKFPDVAFETGMKDYGKIWTLDSLKSTFYNLMVIAELGRALRTPVFKSGDRFHVWYREGAEKLMKWQAKDGSFASNSRSIDGHPTLATAFGLYFLGPPPKK